MEVKFKVQDVPIIPTPYTLKLVEDTIVLVEVAELAS